MMLQLERLTFGVGDRFAQQAEAQLRAFQLIAEHGVDVVPVWNKSNREHTFVGSEPRSVYEAARAAVSKLNWSSGWHVDADHIGLSTVDRYIECSDFFTIDVADSIGKQPEALDVDTFLRRHPELHGAIPIDGIDAPLKLSPDLLFPIVTKYMAATREAGRIHQYIADRKGGAGEFIAEVSMDETDSPQTPPELLVILAMLSDAGVRLQTIAPKFTGRFNKGVDYVGNLAQFESEFNADLAVISHAVSQYELPPNLKISVHSGSDKFSLYPIMQRAMRRTGAGIHLKTAGTTWLEELIGLAESGGDGLELTREIYDYSLTHVDELCAPYASVIDIRRDALPPSAEVRCWPAQRMADSLRHIPTHEHFNSHMRQLLHVSFKVAAKQGAKYLDLLRQNADIVGRNVTENLYKRHMAPLLLE